MTLWLAIAGMTVVTYLLRSSFILLPAGVDIPPLFKRALRYVPAAVLTAIWAPELLVQNQVIYVALGNEKLLAGVVAIAVAWRWRMTSVTIAAGLVALHLFDRLT